MRKIFTGIRHRSSDAISSGSVASGSVLLVPGPELEPVDIPPELILDIFDYLYDALCSSTPPYRTLFLQVASKIPKHIPLLEGQCQFSRLLRVSRMWYHLGAPLLYRRPIITSRTHLSLICATLASSPNLAAHVQHFMLVQYKPVPEDLDSIERPHAQLVASLDACPSLTSLFVTSKRGRHWKRDRPAVFPQLRASLRVLHIGGPFGPISSYLAISSDLSQLEELEFESVQLSPPLPDTCDGELTSLRRICFVQTSAGLRFPPGCATKLARVELYGIAARPAEICDALYSAASTLEVLHLIGQMEWWAFHVLDMASLTNLRTLAVAFVEDVGGRRRVPDWPEWSQTVEEMYVPEWTSAATGAWMFELLRGLTGCETGGLGSIGLKRLQVMHAERPRKKHMPFKETADLEALCARLNIEFQCCSLVPEPERYNERVIHEMEPAERLRVIAGYLRSQCSSEKIASPFLN